MLIDGEKWACEACVKGHRVSNCQHSDRPLQYVNKKGRPVSQCPHCRGLRKSRSAHTRCECGEKAHSKANCGHDGESQDSSCCCSHGARCTCALKKEHTLEPVPESECDAVPVLSGPDITGRPRAATTQSDGSVTTLANGHHKPIHKHNTMAHKCGLPYVVPRAHSIHGASSAGLGNRSVDNIHRMDSIETSHSQSQVNDSIASAQQEQRLVQSEHRSPVLNAGTRFHAPTSTMPELDISVLTSDYNFLTNMEGSTLADHEAPLFSAGLSTASIDWSHYDGLEFNNDSFGPSYSQPPSWFDLNSVDQPGLTSTSTSGDMSEVDDFGVVSEVTPVSSGMVSNQYTSDLGGNLDPKPAPSNPTMNTYSEINQAASNSGNGFDDLDIEQFLRETAEAAVTNPAVVSDDAIYYDLLARSNQTKDTLDQANFDILGTSADDALWMVKDGGLLRESSEPQENHSTWTP